MLKIVENLLNAFSVNYDDDYDNDFEDNFEDDFEEEDTKSYKSSRSTRTAAAKERITKPEPAESKAKPSRTPRSSANKVVPLKSNRTSSYNSAMSVQVIKPMKFEECRDIVDILLRGKSVILNIEGMNVDVAQKIVDFVSGATYSMQGNLQRINNYVIIITPYGVDLSGDFNDLLGGGYDSSTFNSNF